MGWGEATGNAGGSQDHLIIAANTTKIMHILLNEGEEPLSYWTHFIPEANEGKGRVVICPGRDVCPVCIGNTHKTRRRHALNVYDYETKAIKIFEFGNSVSQQLKIVLDQYKSFDMVDISIRRIGEKLNTQYFVMPLPRTEVFPGVGDKFDLAAVKTSNSAADIVALLGMGVAQPPPAPTGNVTGASAEFVPPQPPTSTTTNNEEIVDANTAWEKEDASTLTFGKYKGKTFSEIAEIDISYVKWCSENLTEETLKKEATEIYEAHHEIAKNPAADAPPQEEEVKVQSNTSELVQAVYNVINTDARYKTNFSLVVSFMREASQSDTYPNGKTVLAEYNEAELLKLKELLDKGESQT